MDTFCTLRRPRGHWFFAILACVFLVIFAHYVLKLNHSEHGNRSAFLRWRVQFEDLDDGVNVWDKYAHPNTPLMTVLLKPFLDLPPMLGSSLWFASKAAFALAAILGVLALLDGGERPFPMWGKIIAIALTLRPIAGDLTHGNVNLLILLLIVAMLIATVQGRAKFAGALLGFAIACKLTPALFLLYFLWKRAWTTMAAALLSVMVCVALPATYFGWQRNLEYWQSWHQQMIAPYAAGVVTSEHQNQSLPGLLHRMLTDEPSFSDFEGERKIVLETHNIVSWDRTVVQGIVLTAMALCALTAMRYCRAREGEAPAEPRSTESNRVHGSAGAEPSRRHLRAVAEFSVVILGMLLFCERTWKHHCVTLLLPFSVLAYVVSSGACSRRLRWFAGITLALTCLLMLSTSTGSSEQHDRLGKLAQVYGAYTWAFLLLLASMFVVLRASPFLSSDRR